MSKVFVSLGNVVEIPVEETVDTSVDQHWHGHGTGSLGKGQNGHDDHDGAEDGNNNELAFHDAHNHHSVLLGVLLVPLVPGVGNEQWPEHENQEDDTEHEALGEGHDDTEEGEKTTDHGQDCHASHTSGKWDADAALGVLELFTALELVLHSVEVVG